MSRIVRKRLKAVTQQLRKKSLVIVILKIMLNLYAKGTKT
jgi:hypothetical protein